MRIAGLETIPIALPFSDEYVTARGRLRRREIAIVHVHTDGPTGTGEAVALSLRCGPELRTIVSELDEVCAPALEGVDLERLAARRPPDRGGAEDAAARAEIAASDLGAAVLEGGARAEIAALLARCSGVSAQARSAVDLALHDLAAKLLEVPVWRLLGADRAVPVSCNGTLVAGPPEQVAERAVELVGVGFTTLKLKAGTDADLESVRAVRAAVGPGIQIRIDANGVWHADQALEVLRELEAVSLELVEQPTPDLETMATVRTAAGVPVVADESVTSVADARRAVELGACDAAALKLAKVGGIAAAIDIATVLPAYLSSALDGPIGIAAAAHLAQALPRSGFAAGLAQGLATAQLFAEEPATIGVQLDGGSLMPPSGPGFGVVLDEVAIDALRI